MPSRRVSPLALEWDRVSECVRFMGVTCVRRLTHVLYQEDEDLMSPCRSPVRSPTGSGGSRTSSVFSHNNSFGRTLPAAGLQDGIPRRSGSGGISVFSRQPPAQGAAASASDEDADTMSVLEIVQPE